MKKQLNPTLTYVLSIISLICCCIGGLGIILAAPAYFMTDSKIKAAQLNPDDYEGDINKMKTAKTVALIAMIINALYLLMSIYQIYSVGGWDSYMEQVNEMMQQYQQAQ